MCAAMLRAILIGNYGDGNFGDDVLRQYMTETFACSWTVVTARPEQQSDVPRIPCGLASLRTPWARTIRALWRADLVVFGGGTLFTDAESLFACFLWGLHAFVAFILRKPILFAFQGVGPFRTIIGERIARFFFRRATFISVRDTNSYELVSSWKCSVAIVQTADPAILLFDRYRVTIPEDQRKYLTIIPRTQSGRELFDTARTFLNRSPHLATALCPLQPEKEDPICNAYMYLFDDPILSFQRTPSDLIAFLCESSIILTQRYHGAIAALSVGIRPHIVPLVSGDKLDVLRREIAADANIATHFREQAMAGTKALEQFFLQCSCTK